MSVVQTITYNFYIIGVSICLLVHLMKYLESDVMWYKCRYTPLDGLPEAHLSVNNLVEYVVFILTQFCVNYSVHHACFVQTVILPFLEYMTCSSNEIWYV